MLTVVFCRGIITKWWKIYSYCMFQEASIAASVFNLTPERLKVVNFLTPVMYSEYSFIVKLHPDSIITRFLRPLHLSTWIAILASLIMVTCIINVITNIIDEKDSEHKDASIFHHCEKVLRILCQEGEHWYS